MSSVHTSSNSSSNSSSNPSWSRWSVPGLIKGLGGVCAAAIAGLSGISLASATLANPGHRRRGLQFGLREPIGPGVTARLLQAVDSTSRHSQNDHSNPLLPVRNSRFAGEGVAPLAVAGTGTIDRTNMSATADSYQGDSPPSNALDNNPDSIWHSRYSPTLDPLPHALTIDMKQIRSVSGFTYLPRQNPDSSNGIVGQHKIELSSDGKTWTTVASGTYANDKTLKQSKFPSTSARYLRFTAITEAGNRGPYASAAEINLLTGNNPSDAFTVTVDSEETRGQQDQGTRAIDGDAATFWHTRYTGPEAIPKLPHVLTVDMHQTLGVNALTYTPRQDGRKNGNIGAHRIDVSTDGSQWTSVAEGTWGDNQGTKVVAFSERLARYVRLRALTEAGNRGPWSSAAEVSLSTTDNFMPPAAGLGQWGLTIDFPLVPAAGALQHDTGKLLTFASFSDNNFGGANGLTHTAIFDSATGAVSPQIVTNTGHDMFCPGLSINNQGRTVVTGGDDSAKTSIYNPDTDSWAVGPQMTQGRGYQASATLADGRIFEIGGSWSGPLGGKNGEILNAQGTAWKSLPGCRVADMLTDDAQGVFRADNHGWLFGWKNNSVFQAGPSKNMNWYNPDGGGGSGSVTAAGRRAADADAMNGNAVLYDALKGKILTLGGAPNYQNSAASTNAHIVTIGAPGTAANVTKINSMASARAFANAVVLPDGKVFVTGGQSYAVPFTDTTAAMQPEMWDPATQKFTQLPAMAIPRNYHSIGLLTLDGTIFNGGGGLCGDCATNHFDGQVYTPAYLLNADGSPKTRPTIQSFSPSSAKVGTTISFKTDMPIKSVSLNRFGSNTHTVNTDQRRIAYKPQGSYPNYRFKIDPDPGVALPGYWMLFALNADGTPSKASTLRVTPN